MTRATKQSLPAKSLATFVSRQLNALIPDEQLVSTDELSAPSSVATERALFCFSANKTRYYREAGKTIFNHLNSDQYCTFLYFLCNTLYDQYKNEHIASKVFLLNKYLHGIDLFYSVNLPQVFMLVHPVGTIIGRASYGEYTIFYQNVTIGSSSEGIYPTFGEQTAFYSKSSVLGNSSSGKNTIFSANSFILNLDTPENSVVAGQFPGHRILPNTHSLFEDIFDRIA